MENKSKDPAFLFYSSDFLTGTMTMTNEQVGMYIRLLSLLHQRGKLSEKDMLNICKTYDEDVFSKFQKDDNGFYYNQRLLFEIQRRKEYSESRRRNRQHKNICKSYDRHMENENEIENIDKESIKVVSISKDSKGKFQKPDQGQVTDYFVEIGLDDFTAQAQALLFINHYTSNGWKVGKNKMQDWKAAVRGWKTRMSNYGTNQKSTNKGKSGANALFESIKQDVIAGRASNYGG